VSNASLREWVGVPASLAAQHYLADQLKQQQVAIDAAQRYLNLANLCFRTGIDSFLNVYTAQTSLLTQQETYINLRVSPMTSNVRLVEALGDGWNVNQLPSEKDVARNTNQNVKVDHP